MLSIFLLYFAGRVKKIRLFSGGYKIDFIVVN